ncbi:MAG: bifunctional phosphoribosyl-AMP cyclohydrolase/phosphoribosyl-ATP diphosphatase HisIE [Lachnospiraceae bacterium]|nr:bifunctional phosphoribosyl-AMP cyclohydrolase/phosphoribosyl-ATP diphosphatase HisIE [Lachnospiraceae bacterium]
MNKNFNIDDLKFDEKGLIPAVVIEAGTHKLLMVAWMNRESLAKSMETGLTCFWSRSRQQLWTKGETSGNLQHIVSITADCDSDTLQVIVKKDGPACHTGSETCFFKPLWESDELSDFSLEDLMEIIKDRKVNPKDGSYTTYLFEKGTEKICKKVGEESTEVIIAATQDDKKETIYEIGDLAYHVMVLMLEMGISLEEVRNELASRHVIDKKVKQEHMTS